MTDYTTVALVQNTKRRGFLPSGSGTNTSQILQILTEEMRSSVTAFLKGIREEYLIASVDLAVTSATIPAPERAVGGAFRQIQWINGNGGAVPLNRIEPERTSQYSVSGSEPSGYVFQGNNVLLIPAVTSGTVRLSYQQRPGQLVLPEECGTITGIDTGTGQLTIETKPTTFVSGALFDLVSARPNFVAIALDQAATQDGANTLTISPLPSGLAVGDYVCIAGETPVVQAPLEVHDLLAQFAATKIAEASGSSRLPAIAMGLSNLKRDLSTLLSPRSDGSARPVISNSRLGSRFFRGR